MHIYLAGPEVFLPNAEELGEEKKRLCRKYGHKGFFPLDNELREDWETYPKKTIGMDIARANRELILSCDAVIANLTPFRGPSADVGTVWEIGYALGLGKIVAGYTTTRSKYIERVDHTDGYDADAYFVEDFDLEDNLMIPGGLSTPLVVGDGVEISAFEKCLQEVNKAYIQREFRWDGR